jgi:acetolactate synthase-1/2/3 large subunit
VYLTATREVMEEQLEPYSVDPAGFGAVAPAALAPEVTAQIAAALTGAKHPLIVTSYLGRDPSAVPSLRGRRPGEAADHDVAHRPGGLPPLRPSWR